MNTLISRRALGALLVSTGMALSLPAFAQNEIKIGYNADQSASGAAELGLSGLYGFQAAIEDLTAKQVWTVIFAIISIVAGIVLLTTPLWGALVIWTVIGISLLILGVVQIVRAFTFGKELLNA